MCQMEVGMKKRTKEEMAAYQRDRRKKLVTPGEKLVTPAPKLVTSVTPTAIKPPKCNTVPVTPDDKDTVISILRGRIALLEKEVSELKKLIPKKDDSPYRGF